MSRNMIFLAILVLNALNVYSSSSQSNLSIRNFLMKRSSMQNSNRNFDGYPNWPDMSFSDSNERSLPSTFKDNNFNQTTSKFSNSTNTIPILTNTFSNIYKSSMSHNNKFNLLRTVLDKSKKSLSMGFNQMTVNGFSHQEQNKANCVDPDDEYLENLLSEYQVFFRKYQETILKNNIEPNLLDSFGKYNGNIDPNHFIEQSQCVSQERKMNLINQASLCPWRYVTKARHDRYPLLRTEVKCTCDKCSTFADKLPQNVYGCLPVLKPVPVLLKGICGDDGFFNWTPSTEEVNVACVCAHKKAFFPIRFK